MFLQRLLKPGPARSAGRAALCRHRGAGPHAGALRRARRARHARRPLRGLHPACDAGAGPAAARVGPAGGGGHQALFDAYISGLDNGLRELAVGDLSVGKTMRRLGEAFYGRAKALAAAFAAPAGPRRLDSRLIPHRVRREPRPKPPRRGRLSAGSPRRPLDAPAGRDAARRRDHLAGPCLTAALACQRDASSIPPPPAKPEGIETRPCPTAGDLHRRHGRRPRPLGRGPGGLRGPSRSGLQRPLPAARRRSGAEGRARQGCRRSRAASRSATPTR